MHDNKTPSPPTTCGLLGEELTQRFCLLRAEALFFLAYCVPITYVVTHAYCVHDNKTSSPPTTCGLLGGKLTQCFCLLRAEALFFLFPGRLRADTSFGSGSGLDPDSIRSVDPDPGA